MNSIINNISINNTFWIQFRENLISFGYSGLPSNIHLTIAFDKKSPDLNFHITKNINNGEKKPRISIVYIEKKLFDKFEEDFVPIAISLMRRILIPFDLDELKSKFELGFVSFESLNDKNGELLFEGKFKDSFKDIAKVRKKTRLKIKGDIESKLESFFESEDVISSMLDKIIEFPKEFNKKVEGGIIFFDNKSISVIRIEDKWFTIKDDLTTLDFLSFFINPELSRSLIWKTKRAIILLKQANSYKDTEQFNSPIRIIRNKPSE